MADTKIVLATMRSRVYAEMGSPAADLPDSSGGLIETVVTSCARKILSKISLDDGEDAALDYLTTVADQQAYDIPDNRDITEVIWGPQGTTDLQMDPYAPVFGNIPGSSLAGSAMGFPWRSDQVMADIRRVDAQRQYRYEILAGSVYLYPVPSTAGLQVPYIYRNTAGAATDLDAKYERALLFLAASDCARILSNVYRGRGTTYTEQGVVGIDKATDWSAISEKYRADYEIEIEEILA